MQQHQAMTVARVKALLFVAVFKQGDTPICQNAVAIHQEQLDACGPPFNLCQFIHLSRLFHLEEFDSGQLPTAADTL